MHMYSHQGILTVGNEWRECKEEVRPSKKEKARKRKRHKNRLLWLLEERKRIKQSYQVDKCTLYEAAADGCRRLRSYVC